MEYTNVGEYHVTPRVGVWIETRGVPPITQSLGVTPRVGVWIETNVGYDVMEDELSLPAWECGLKHQRKLSRHPYRRHSPRGSVD